METGSCPDGGGSVQRTGDAGQTWDDVAIEQDAFVVAVPGAQGCPGVQVVAAGTGTAEALGCADVSAEPGRLAISAVGESVWLWAGDAVQVSGDGGRTWG